MCLVIASLALTCFSFPFSYPACGLLRATKCILGRVRIDPASGRPEITTFYPTEYVYVCYVLIYHFRLFRIKRGWFVILFYFYFFFFIYLLHLFCRPFNWPPCDRGMETICGLLTLVDDTLFWKV